MIVDASALVAILLREEGWEGLAIRMDAADARYCGPVSLFETVAAVCRTKRIDPAEALAEVRAFLEAAEIAVAPAGAQTAEAALDAHARYGKGRHPAALNMGDCFSYAHARELGLPLLYKGDDFARTDLA